MAKKIAFIAYESPFTPCGGVAAVIGHLPSYVKEVSGADTIVITPYHYDVRNDKGERRIEKLSPPPTPVKSFSLSFANKPIGITIQQYNSPKHVYPCFFLQPDDLGYFAGNPHPYLLDRQDPQKNAAKLLRDSLLFGMSVYDALDIIDPNAEWILMMQDWEAATTVLDLASREELSRFKLFITLHNSYDSGVTDSHLSQVGINKPARCPGETVLQRAIPLVRSPVFTVSEQFASDLVEDDFQVYVMAPHLQELLKPRLLGVNNGPFTQLAFDRNILQQSRQGDFKSLQDWKTENRKKALKALDEFSPSADKPVWGDLKKFDRDESACWFVMAGRDDSRQKGYDVAASAIESLLQNPANKMRDARFFFFPIPGDEGLNGLDFLKKLAENFPEQVLVFPFIWQQGFFATLQGSHYGIMPSLYEPFGMANEFYLKGAVGIGRATGGILHQIAPLWASSAFSHAAELQTIRWHPESVHPSGILWREKDRIASSVDDWQGINDAKYNIPGGTPNKPNRVQQRMQYPLFRSMIYELAISIMDGVNIYFSEQKPTLYWRMLIEGIDFVRNNLSWERAAQEYARNVISDL